MDVWVMGHTWIGEGVAPAVVVVVAPVLVLVMLLMLVEEKIVVVSLLGTPTQIYVFTESPVQFDPRDGFQSTRSEVEIPLAVAIVVQLPPLSFT